MLIEALQDSNLHLPRAEGALPIELGANTSHKSHASVPAGLRSLSARCAP